MLNLKKADLTTTEQKVVAGALLVLVLVILYIITPPLVVLFKNLLLLACFATPVVIIAIFPQSTWALFKQLSWELTKKIISSNPVWHLWRGHEYMVSRMEELRKHINSVMSIQKKTQARVEELIRENKQLEQSYSIQNNEGNKKIYLAKIGQNKNLIDGLIPKIEMAKVQSDKMSELLEVWRTDTAIMKNNIEGLSTQYELMKELNGATKAASSFLGNDTPEMKMFKESMRQVEKSIFDYTANVESFQRDIIPTLALSQSKSTLLEEDGLKLIEEYKKKRIA